MLQVSQGKPNEGEGWVHWYQGPDTNFLPSALTLKLELDKVMYQPSCVWSSSKSGPLILFSLQPAWMIGHCWSIPQISIVLRLLLVLKADRTSFKDMVSFISGWISNSLDVVALYGMWNVSETGQYRDKKQSTLISFHHPFNIKSSFQFLEHLHGWCFLHALEQCDL